MFLQGNCLFQKACGILDTNCFEIKWDRGVARGLFNKIALINHDCAPNCRKYFDAQRKMHVVSCNSIKVGQELYLSYTNPLLSTPVRQAILSQTKCFKCICQRCRDPSELGSSLSSIKCNKKPCQGTVSLIDPLSSDSDLQCDKCENILSCDMAKIIQETAMNSLKESETCAEKTLGTLTNLERFLPQSNHIMVDLKMKLIDQVIAEDAHRKEFEDTAIQFCLQLLQLARLIAPGSSKLRGVLSMKFHQLTEKGPDPLVIPKQLIDGMFGEDQSVLLLD